MSKIDLEIVCDVCILVKNFTKELRYGSNLTEFINRCLENRIKNHKFREIIYPNFFLDALIFLSSFFHPTLFSSGQFVCVGAFCIINYLNLKDGR